MTYCSLLPYRKQAGHKQVDHGLVHVAILQLHLQETVNLLDALVLLLVLHVYTVRLKVSTTLIDMVVWCC